MHRDGRAIRRLLGARRPLIRPTAVGFAVGAIVFAVLGMWMNSQMGAPWFSNPGPIGILAIIGGTTAGLVSPMFFRRRKRPASDETKL